MTRTPTTVTTWDSWPVRPNGAVLLHHLGQDHPDQVEPSLARMYTKASAPVAAEAYAGVEDLPPC